MKKFAPVVVRFAVALILVWFASQQLLDPQVWTGLVPAWAMQVSHLSAFQIVHINGWFELLLGVLLILGFYTRFFSAIAFLHILGIAFTVGVTTSIGVRDLGLTASAFSIFLSGTDIWSLDLLFEKKEDMFP